MLCVLCRGVGCHCGWGDLLRLPEPAGWRCWRSEVWEQQVEEQPQLLIGVGRNESRGPHLILGLISSLRRQTEVPRLPNSLPLMLGVYTGIMLAAVRTVETPVLTWAIARSCSLSQEEKTTTHMHGRKGVQPCRDHTNKLIGTLVFLLYPARSSLTQLLNAI